MMCVMFVVRLVLLLPTKQNIPDPPDVSTQFEFVEEGSSEVELLGLGFLLLLLPLLLSWSSRGATITSR